MNKKVLLISLALLVFSAISLHSQTVKDIDGNVYKTVTIGTQIWMVENLKVTHYTDSTAIPNVTKNREWKKMETGAYCNYNNDENYVNSYGRLYNWYTIETNKLCPTGWHVPTTDEWTILTDYLIKNGYGYEGSGDDIAKSLAATSGWDILNAPTLLVGVNDRGETGLYTSGLEGNVAYDQARNNSSGFSALPGGRRNDYDGSFSEAGREAYWWCSTPTKLFAWDRVLSHDNGILFWGNTYDRKNGFSVRCVKD